jgi:hypothetical protein
MALDAGTFSVLPVRDRAQPVSFGENDPLEAFTQGSIKKSSAHSVGVKPI